MLPILTLKRSILDAHRDDSLPSGFAELEVGRVVPGVVQSVKSYGVFLRLACWGYNKHVLAPLRHLADFYVESPEELFQIGQTLYCKVT